MRLSAVNIEILTNRSVFFYHLLILAVRSCFYNAFPLVRVRDVFHIVRSILHHRIKRDSDIVDWWKADRIRKSRGGNWDIFDWKLPSKSPLSGSKGWVFILSTSIKSEWKIYSHHGGSEKRVLEVKQFSRYLFALSMLIFEMETDLLITRRFQSWILIKFYMVFQLKMKNLFPINYIQLVLHPLRV